VTCPDDREGFTAWIRPHWRGMSQLAFRLAPDGDWEDVLQEALAVAWRKRRQFDPARGTARNWLLALVADQARKGHRRAARRVELTRADEARSESVDLDLERALTRLTRRQRLTVELHYYLGLPVADVAAVLSCAPGTVKSTLADARAALHAVLGEEYR
jgi:RNA polymerase sigma-70 factor (ECF subfamily)